MRKVLRSRINKSGELLFTNLNDLIGQEVEIILITEYKIKKKIEKISLLGALKKYANPKLRRSEKSAFSEEEFN